MPISRPKECDEPKKGFLFQKLEEVDFILRMTETVGFPFVRCPKFCNVRQKLSFACALSKICKQAAVSGAAAILKKKKKVKSTKAF